MSLFCTIRQLFQVTLITDKTVEEDIIQLGAAETVNKALRTFMLGCNMLDIDSLSVISVKEPKQTLFSLQYQIRHPL